MKAFPFDRHIVESYARFSKSFSKIKAADLREAIEQEYEEGRFWPDALLALNPRYEAGPTACTATGFLDTRLRYAAVGREQPPAHASPATPASGRLGSCRGSAAARGPCDGPHPGTVSAPNRCEWPPAAVHPTARVPARGAPGHHSALGRICVNPMGWARLVGRAARDRRG